MNIDYNRAFCNQTVKTLIRRRVLLRLIWVCTDCLFPTKRTLCVNGLIQRIQTCVDPDHSVRKEGLVGPDNNFTEGCTDLPNGPKASRGVSVPAFLREPIATNDVPEMVWIACPPPPSLSGSAHNRNRGSVFPWSMQLTFITLEILSSYTQLLSVRFRKHSSYSCNPVTTIS